MNETTNEEPGPIRAVMDRLTEYAREQMLTVAERGGDPARRIIGDTLTMNEQLVKVYGARVRELESQLAKVTELATMVPNPPPGHHWTSGKVEAPGQLVCVTCMPRPVAELEENPIVHTGSRASMAHSFRLVPTSATECLAAFMDRDGAR